MSRLRILVSGYLVRRPVGGLSWHYLHYVLGLHAMGHDVYFVEDSEDVPSCFDPREARRTDEAGIGLAFQRTSVDPSYGLEYTARTFDALSIGERWAYYDAHTGCWLGPAATNVDDLWATADVFVNVSHSQPARDWMLSVPHRVLVDTDPVFNQARHLTWAQWLDRALAHNVFLTFGENYGAPDCGTPSDGLPWQPTRQPLCLTEWPVQETWPSRAFTTVMSWRSYAGERQSGRHFGMKSDSFDPFLTLPATTGSQLALALDGDHAARQTLEQHGWDVVDALSVTRDPFRYRSFVQRSGAEFTVAKHGYAAARCGWFSERSANYLASGRPVITQETGFSNWMPVGNGVVSFSTPEEARAAIEMVSRDLTAHGRAARRLAEELFEHRTVLTNLLEAAAQPTPIDELESSVVNRSALVDYREFVATLLQRVPVDGSCVVVDDNTLGFGKVFRGRRCLPFLERDGEYNGRPVDDAQAVSELERMRAAGATSIFVHRSAAWWLEHYEGFHDHLRGNARLIAHTDEFVAFDLRR